MAKAKPNYLQFWVGLGSIDDHMDSFVDSRVIIIDWKVTSWQDEDIHRLKVFFGWVLFQQDVEFFPFFVFGPPYSEQEAVDMYFGTVNVFSKLGGAEIYEAWVTNSLPIFLTGSGGSLAYFFTFSELS